MDSVKIKKPNHHFFEHDSCNSQVISLNTMSINVILKQILLKKCKNWRYKDEDDGDIIGKIKPSNSKKGLHNLTNLYKQSSVEIHCSNTLQ